MGHDDLIKGKILNLCINPLPDMPILGSSNSAVNYFYKDIMSKIWTNGDTII